MGPAPAGQNGGSVTAAVARPGAMVAFAAKPAASALFFGSSFVDGEIASIKFGAVHGVDGFLRFFRRGHRDESKAARASGSAVGHEVGLGDHAMRREGVL